MNTEGVTTIGSQPPQGSFVFPPTMPTPGPPPPGYPLQTGPDPIQLPLTGSLPDMRQAPGLAPGLVAAMDPRLVQSMGSGPESKPQRVMQRGDTSREEMQRLESQIQFLTKRVDQQASEIQSLESSSRSVEVPQQFWAPPDVAPARQVEVPQVVYAPPAKQAEYIPLVSEQLVYPPAGSNLYNTGVAIQPQRQPRLQPQQQGFGGYSSSWSYGLFECCNPMQCLAGFCCPCLVTYEMFAMAVPFELSGFGCFAAADSALMLTVLVYCLYFFSFSLLFYVVMLSAIVGIKKKLMLDENNCLTCFKICCCFCCYQIQILRQMESVGWPVAVTKQVQYGSMPASQPFQQQYQPPQQVQYGSMPASQPFQQQYQPPQQVQYGSMPASQPFEQQYQSPIYLQPRSSGYAPPPQQVLMQQTMQQPNSQTVLVQQPIMY